MLLNACMIYVGYQSTGLFLKEVEFCQINEQFNVRVAADFSNFILHTPGPQSSYNYLITKGLLVDTHGSHCSPAFSYNNSLSVRATNLTGSFACNALSKLKEMASKSRRLRWIVGVRMKDSHTPEISSGKVCTH